MSLPAATVDPPADFRCAPAAAGAGVDIGGTKIAAALIDAAGDVPVCETVPTPIEGDPGAMLSAADDLIVLLTRAAAERGLELVGLGIAVPELVDRAGRVASAAVIPGLADRDLAHRWSSIGRTVIESDVRAAAVAEARRGAGRGRESFAYVSVGTGISSCLVIRGELWAGSRGGAILLGSGVMAECDGARWVLEEIASGPALLRQYRELGGRRATVAELLQARAQESPATEAIARCARALGIGIATLINLLDPEAIVVGGGLGSAAGQYWEQAVASAREHVYWDVARDTPIVQAQHRGRAGAIGAALLGLGADVR